MNCRLCGSTIRNENQNRVGANLRALLKICESCYILRINKVLEMISQEQIGERA